MRLPDTQLTPSPARVAIIGATGYIGGRLVPRLLDAGYAVRCLVRSPGKLADRVWADRVEIHQAQLGNVGVIARSLVGCEAVYYLVHSMIAVGHAYAEEDRRLARNVAEAARQAGVGRIIYLGGLGEIGPDLSTHLASRREVEHELASTGVPVTVFRSAMIIGSGSASFEILRYLVERLPVMITPKWVSTLCQPIAVRNVIAYLVSALSVPETIGNTFDIGGPDVMRYREIMQAMAEELGLRRRWIIPVPVLTPRLSSYWIHLVTPLSHSIARPLAEGLRNPVVCQDDRIAALIPQELLTVRESIRAALVRYHGGGVETSWSMAGPIPGDPDWAGGKVFRDARQSTVEAPAPAVFRAVCRLGGGRGWHAHDWLWRIRGAMDVLVGGPGLRRGRRDPDHIAYGEALDFWRVVRVERDRRLVLRAEMRLPGEAVLDFRIDPQEGGRSTLYMTALFKPRGLVGLLYWHGVVPFHHIVFKGMLEGVTRDATQLAAEAQCPSGGNSGRAGMALRPAGDPASSG